jgi:hypothetical protein
MQFLHPNHFTHCDGFAFAPDRRQMKPAVGPAASRSEAKSRSPHERSDMRGRFSGFDGAPGYRCAHPGYVRHERKKRKAERRKTLLHQPPHQAVRRRAERSASAFRRSTTAPAEGTYVTQGAAQARLPGTWLARALPTIACPSPVSTSHASRNAGRLMPEPPGSRMTNPDPRAPHPFPPRRCRRHGVLLRRNGIATSTANRGTRCNANHWRVRRVVPKCLMQPHLFDRKIFSTNRDGAPFSA